MEYWYYTVVRSGGYRDDYGLFDSLEDAESHARENVEPEKVFERGNPYNCKKCLITPNETDPIVKIKCLTYE